LICLLALAELFCQGCSKQPDQAKQAEDKNPAFKKPVEVSTSAEKNTTSADANAKKEIYIGDKIKYTITVDAKKELKIKFPEFGENLAGFAIKDYGYSEPKETGDRTVRQQWYLLDTYVTGDYEIPEAVIKYTGADNKENETRSSEKLKVTVKSLLAESGKEPELKDIRGPVEIKANYKKYYIWGGIGAALLIAGLATFFFTKRKKEIMAAMAAARPAHEIAYEELNRIQALNLIAQNLIKEYYYLINDCLRHYIENRFSLRAPEKTTEEFMADMATTDALNKEHKQLVKDFLYHCDLVKYAKFTPTESQITETFNSAKKFIDETKIQTALPEEEAEDEETDE